MLVGTTVAEIILISEATTQLWLRPGSDYHSQGTLEVRMICCEIIFVEDNK